ncbi:hypothetical protein MKX03_027055 [Papaver bracteatum]|nr:hypothetical protein MKX03_027055 [Papaver bracteatum]
MGIESNRDYGDETLGRYRRYSSGRYLSPGRCYLYRPDDQTSRSLTDLVGDRESRKRSRLSSGTESDYEKDDHKSRSRISNKRIRERKYHKSNRTSKSSRSNKNISNRKQSVTDSEFSDEDLSDSDSDCEDRRRKRKRSKRKYLRSSKKGSKRSTRKQSVTDSESSDEDLYESDSDESSEYEEDRRRRKRKRSKSKSSGSSKKRSKISKRNHPAADSDYESSDEDSYESDSDESSEYEEDRRRRKRSKSRRHGGRKSHRKSTAKNKHSSERTSSKSSKKNRVVSESDQINSAKSAASDAEEVHSKTFDTTLPYDGNDNDVPVGPMPLCKAAEGGGRISYGGALRPGEGDAMAQFVQQGKRIPRRGEVGLSADEISRFESLGYVMSGSRHQRMNSIRIRKENQIYSAEDKRALAEFNYEEKAKREQKVMASLKRMVERQKEQDA